MAPFTELISVKLDSPSSSTPENSGWEHAIKELVAQSGCSGLQWARRTEDSGWLVIKIDWTTPDSYTAPNNRKHVELLLAPLSTKEALISDTAVYSPLSASEVFSATSITEILTLLVPSSMSVEDMTAIEQAAVKVSSSTAPRENGVKAVTHAWLTDKIDHPESPTGKARGLRFFLAWPSLEIHRRIMAEEGFKMNMGAIKQKCLPAVFGRGMFHAEFLEANNYPSVNQ